MRSALVILVALTSFAIFGVLIPPDRAEAAYYSKSVGCPTGGRTCTGSTNRGIENGETYYATGKSTASLAVNEAFAWVRGTNIYHPGSVLWEEACQINNGKTCTTSRAYLCDVLPPPAGCGANNYTNWYGTNWSWFKPVTTEYATFTATRSGADSAYCWNTMECV